MANYAQNSLVPYKDYVATQPVEAEVLVGSRRQEELNLGIQKVNDVFSRVAGVDVLRDSDKKYIQDNLSSLTSNISKGLSGDFSDSRIVNQITGAATQIYKDPVVQNAIISTNAVREGQAEQTAARKAGKNGPANDYEFNSQVSNYTNSEDPSAYFNYKYEQYTDVNKHIFDIVDKIKPSGTSIDEAFHTDPKTGKMVLNESTIRNGFKGVRPDQLRAALRAGLSPQDWRQLELDGVYQYSNVPDEQFATSISGHYQSIANTYLEKLKLLENSSTTSGEEKQKIDKDKADIKKELENIKNEYEGITSTFASGDTKSAKAKLHSINTINQFASSLAYGEVVSQYVGDTPQQMEKWRQDKAQDWAKWSADYAQKNQFHNDNMALEQIKIAQKEKELKGLSTLGSFGMPLDKDQLPAVTIDKFSESIKENKLAMDAQRNSFIKLNKRDPNSKEGQEWYDAKVAAYDKKSPTLTPIELEHFKAREAQEKELNGDVALVTELKDKYEKSGNYKKAADFIPKDAPSVAYQEDENHRWTFSPSDFVNYNENLKKYKVVGNSFGSSGGGGAPEVTYNLTKAKKELSATQYKLLEIEASGGKTESEQKILDYVRKYQKEVNNPYAAEIAKMGKDLEKELNERISIHQSANTGVPIATPAQKDAARTLLSDMAIYADKYSNGKIGNTDAQTLLKLQKDDNKAISFQTAPGNKWQEPVNNLIITGSDGTIHTIPLTQEQKQSVVGNDYDASPTDRNFAQFENQIIKSGGFTTQLGPKPYLGKSNFPSVNRYSIQGDIEKGNNGYQFKLTITDPSTGRTTLDIVYPPSGLVDKAGALQIMNQLNDTYIFELLNGATPTAEDLKKLSKDAQKPSY